jgi:hypothetical protein
MKIIQILITALALLYANFKANAQTEKDTVKISFKGKNYKIDTKIEPEEEERNRTLKFVDTMKKTMVLVTVSTRAFDNEPWEATDQGVSKDTSHEAKLQKKIVNLVKKTQEKERRHFIETALLPTIDLGFASTMNEIENSRAYTPKLGKSANLNIGLIRQNMNIYNERILFSYGVSLNNYYLKYDDKQTVQYINEQGYLKRTNDSVNNYDKNRQDVRYITVPVLLEYHSKNDNFSIGAGVEFGFNGRTKLTLKGDRESLEFKQKNGNNIKINPEQMNAVLRVGIRNFSVYGRYSLTDMYQSSAYEAGQNPHQQLFSVGVCFFGI